MIENGTARDRWAIKRHQLSHGLLRVSRQIYHEALPFCYRNSQFYFENLSMLLSFLNDVRQARGLKEVRADQFLYNPKTSDFSRCWSTRHLQLMREAWRRMITLCHERPALLAYMK